MEGPYPSDRPTERTIKCITLYYSEVLELITYTEKLVKNTTKQNVLM